MPTETTLPNPSLTAGFQDFCNVGLEQVIELEKASLATLVSVSSYAIDLSRSAGLFSPMAFSALPGDYLDSTTKFCASLLDLQMCWLPLLLPQAAQAHAGNHGNVRATANALETGMDKVVGVSAGRKS